jgi:GTP cyclohydrolase II
MHVPVTEIRPQLEVVAQAPVPTRFGVFQMSVFHWGASNPALGLSPDHVALVMGELRGKRDVLVRVHSECLTSEVFGSLKCDCREQLEAAQAEIGRRGQGAVLYLRQEGRGIGLTNKIKAYQLQSDGHDTVDANRILGLPDDARDYAPAAGDDRPPRHRLDPADDQQPREGERPARPRGDHRVAPLGDHRPQPLLHLVPRGQAGAHGARAAEGRADRGPSRDLTPDRRVRPREGVRPYPGPVPTHSGRR